MPPATLKWGLGVSLGACVERFPPHCEHAALIQTWCVDLGTLGRGVICIRKVDPLCLGVCETVHYSGTLLARKSS